MGAFSVLFACSFLFSILIDFATSNIIYPSQSIRDGATLLSTGGNFELGFFSPGNSTKRFLGIWYKKSPRTVIWVANREVPLSNTLGALNISSKGILVLYSSTNDVVWSSNSSRTAEDSVAELLETGNLVVREGNDSNPDNFLWQSFDHPGDTFILGMKLGSNFVTKIDKFLSSWKSADSSNVAEVLRCIHVALLCVQQRPEDRPTMSTVVVMLGSENPLPQPKQPGFFMGKNSSSKHEAHSLNEVSLTLLEAR